MKAAKIFFVVYTLGLDARVLTGKYQFKSFEKYAIAQEFETDKQACLGTSKQYKRCWISMQSKSDQNCQCGYGETQVFELESKSGKPHLFLCGINPRIFEPQTVAHSCLRDKNSKLVTSIFSCATEFDHIFSDGYWWFTKVSIKNAVIRWQIERYPAVSHKWFGISTAFPPIFPIWFVLRWKN